jgi:hypothetical protein
MENSTDYVPELLAARPIFSIAEARLQALPEDSPVQAYAKLAGPDWTYFVQSLSIVLGRRSEGVTDNEGIDVDLGTEKKNVSRKHAQITYNYNMRKWELLVLGRNGLRVNETFYKPQSDPIGIESGVLIEIAGIIFAFELPPEGNEDQAGERGQLAQPARPKPAPKKKAAKKKKRPAEELIEDVPPKKSRKRESKEPSVEVRRTPTIAGKAKPKLRIIDIISDAIRAHKLQRLGLNDIYDYFKDTYEYYRDAPSATWQDTIRHTLSGSRVFVKFPKREVDGPDAKGNYWMLAGAPVLPSPQRTVNIGVPRDEGEDIDMGMEMENNQVPTKAAMDAALAAASAARRTLHSRDIEYQHAANAYVSLPTLSNYFAESGNTLSDLMPHLTMMAGIVARTRHDTMERYRWEAWRMETPPEDIVLRHFPYEFFEIGLLDHGNGMTTDLIQGKSKWDVLGRKDRGAFKTTRPTKQDKEEAEEVLIKTETEEMKEKILWTEKEPLASKVWRNPSLNARKARKYFQNLGRVHLTQS